MLNPPSQPTDQPERAPICVLLCVDSAYLPQAGITIGSILRSNPGASFEIYVAGPGLDPEQFDAIFAPLRASHSSWRLHRCDFAEDQLPDLPVTAHISRSTYTRILLDHFVDPRHQRVLYLDADMIVRADLTPLWSTRLDGAVLAAARDHFRLDLPAIGFAPDEPYFNAGMLLIDMERWRALDCERRVLDFLAREIERLPWMDQDALNIVLRGQVRFVGLEWNFQPRCADVPPDFLGLPVAEYDQLRADPSLIHYTTSYKPWNAPYRVHYSDDFFSAARFAGLTFARARPSSLKDHLMQLKTWLRWNFPRGFRFLRQTFRPAAAAQMYRAGTGS